jgi:putative hydrolase of the HAD superfamily
VSVDGTIDGGQTNFFRFEAFLTDRMRDAPQFLYFDLGNVLLMFDHRRGCRQMAELTDTDPQLVWNFAFESGLELEYEAGLVSSQEFYQRFCEATGTRPDFDKLAVAASDIFEVNVPVKAIVGQLLAAGHRLGLLSNTNEMHWRFLSDDRYGMIPAAFEQVVLSYEVKSVKPDPTIFRIAAKKAGLRPNQIFYVDDVAGHVAAAREVGFDAVQYSSPQTLVDDLKSRGIGLNY